MSYTVVIDERIREQRFENRLNELHRHCRIGRIMHKMQILGGAMVPNGHWEEFPPRLPSFPTISTPNTGSPSRPDWFASLK